MRKLFWRLHSIVGLAAGLGLVVIGLSGSVLVFHEEIAAVFSPEATRVEPTAAGRLPLTELVASVEAAFPAHAVTGWAFDRDDPRAADGAYVMPWGTREWRWITVDPYRGEVLSGPVEADKTFKHWLLHLHYELLLGHVGMAISGLLGVALCFLGLSGLWLYRRFWRTFFRLRWRASARMLLGDIHRFTGVCAVGFNLLLGFTGAWWNLTHVWHELTEDHHHPEDEVLFHERLFPLELDLDALLARADTHVPGFVTHYVSLPWSPEEGRFTLWGRSADAGWWRSVHGSQVTYTAGEGSFVSAYDIREAPLGTQVVDAFEPLHYGYFGGLPIKLLWSAAGLAPGILALSGMAIWWKRRRSRPSAAAASRAFVQEQREVTTVPGG